MSESASCSTSDFDSEAQLTGRTEESTSPSPPRPLRLSSAPPRDSPVPRLGLNLGKPAPPLAPQATSRKVDESSEQPAALSIDLLSSAVQLCGSQHPQQDLPKARRQLSERLGVPEQCLSFYEVRQLQDDGTPSSSGQRVAVHVSGSGVVQQPTHNTGKPKEGPAWVAALQRACKSVCSIKLWTQSSTAPCQFPAPAAGVAAAAESGIASTNTVFIMPHLIAESGASKTPVACRLQLGSTRRPCT